jgi:hypothetical protein
LKEEGTITMSTQHLEFTPEQEAALMKAAKEYGCSPYELMATMLEDLQEDLHDLELAKSREDEPTVPYKDVIADCGLDH